MTAVKPLKSHGENSVQPKLLSYITTTNYGFAFQEFVLLIGLELSFCQSVAL